MAGMGGKPGVSRRDQPGALARAKGEGGLRQRWPGLHFNEGEQAFAFGDQVNFTGFGAASLGEDKPTFSSQGFGGEGFGILTGDVGAPATQQAMGGWGLAGHGEARHIAFASPPAQSGCSRPVPAPKGCGVFRFRRDQGREELGDILTD